MIFQASFKLNSHEEQRIGTSWCHVDNYLPLPAQRFEQHAHSAFLSSCDCGPQFTVLNLAHLLAGICRLQRISI